MPPELHDNATEALAFLTEESEAITNYLPLVLSLLVSDNATAQTVLAHMETRQADISATRLVIQNLLKELDKYVN